MATGPVAAAGGVKRWVLVRADGWLGGVGILGVAFAVVQILTFSFGRDQGIYALVAEGLLDGRVPYRDLWDFKPPGIYWVYAAAEALFGKSMLSPRWIEVAGLVGMALALVRLSREFFGGPTAGLLAAGVASVMAAQLDYWHTGQPETFGGFLTVYAVLLVTTNHDGRKRFWAWAAAGTLFGVAFLLKPHLAGGAVVCAAYLARRESTRVESQGRAVVPFAVVGFASLIPIALCVGWFALRGGLDDLYTTFFEITPEYTAINWVGQTALPMFWRALEETFVRFSALLPVGCVLAAILPPIHTRERELTFLLLGIASIHVTGVAMQGKFFAYHYAATFPLLSLIAGIGFYKAWRRLVGWATPGAVLFFAGFALLFSARTATVDLDKTFWTRTAMRMAFLGGSERYPDRAALDADLSYVADYNLASDRAVARVLAERTRPEDGVFVWGFEPVIYWLSERKAPTRFIYNVPQRLASSRSWSQAELFRDLSADPPAAIVVQRGDIFPAVTGDWLDSNDALMNFRELDLLLAHEYEWSERIDRLDIYLRKAKP